MMVKNNFLNLPFVQSIVCRKFDEIDARMDELKRVIMLNDGYNNNNNSGGGGDCVYDALKMKINKLPTRNRRKELFLSKTALLISEYNDIVKKRRNYELLVDIVREYIAIVKELAIKYNWVDLMIKLDESNVMFGSSFGSSSSSSSSSSYVNDEKMMLGGETCANCKTHDAQFVVDEENKRKTCTVCHCQIKLMETGHTHQDYNRVNIIGKFVYNRVVHFQDCIKQFQGKQNCKIPAEVYAKLDAKFKSLRLLVDSDNNYIRYAKITPEIIKILLKELKLSKHYENVNVIYYALTNKRVADITELEDKLVEDFKELLNLYDTKYLKENNGIDRKNFMNVQYILFQLLRKHGYPCSIQDFSVLKTADRKLFHDNICSQLFKQLGWDFTPTF